MSGRLGHNLARSGLTLVEILVASTLALLVLSLTIQLFFPALRAWTDGQRRSEVNQSVLMTTSWLGDDIVRSAPGSVVLTPEGVLGMKCAQGQTDGHTNAFDQLVAYWQDQGDLYRTAWDLSVPEAVTSPLSLDALHSAPDRRRVASGVTRFDVELHPDTPWLVGLTLEVDKDGRKGAIVTSYSSVYAPSDREILE